jgi:hypothetical protein
MSTPMRFLIRLYRGRSRKYPQNDTNNLKSRLDNLKINSDVPNSVIDDLVDELRITLKCGGNPSGVQQKLEVLEHIKVCKSLREYAKKDISWSIREAGFAFNYRVRRNDSQVELWIDSAAKNEKAFEELE